MKNKEKFAKEIVEVAIQGGSLAKTKGCIVSCCSISCRSCDFNGYNACGDVSGDVACGDVRRDWANAEHEEPKIQPEVRNCKIDDKILVSDDGKRWYPRHFADIESDVVFAWDTGGTSWTRGNRMTRTVAWGYAKLPESEGE